MAADTEKNIAELIEHYRTERKKLTNLRAPAMRMTNGSAADEEYRIEAAAIYALDFIDVLLQRIQALEARVDAAENT